MIKKYQPLIFQKLDIQIPGVHIRGLVLHRHMPETTAVRSHSHKFAQCLLYLNGKGTQHIRNHAYQVQTGTAVFVPAKMEHAFHREANRRPICLVIDFDWRGSRAKQECVARLPLSILHEVRQALAGIAPFQRPGQTGPPFQISCAILRLLELLLVGLHSALPLQRNRLSPVPRKVESLLDSPESANLSLEKLARRAGYQHDYLNRLLKSQAGLTLGQFRARKLIDRAQRLLQRAESIAEVSGAVGFSDPNYFSRWFRKQTGMTPSQWRQKQ